MTPDAALGVAIVGAGWAGTRQAEAVVELGRSIRVVALVDTDADFLAERAAALSIGRTYTDLGEALRDAEVEAVSICTPHRLHAPMTIQAAEAGRHVLVEKPMATTVVEATAMIDAAHVNGVRLYVAESAVYQPDVIALRELVSTRRYVGELTAAAYIAGYRAPDPSYPGRREWLTRPELGGTGVWVLNGIHVVAQLRAVLGEVRAVHFVEHRASSFARDDLEGTMSGLLTMESGLGVWLLESPETRFPVRQKGFQLYGDRGIVFGHASGYFVSSDELDGDDPVWMEYSPAPLSAYALEMAAFADHVGGVDGPTDGISERRSLAIVEAGLESARRGRPVDLRERYGPL